MNIVSGLTKPWENGTSTNWKRCSLSCYIQRRQRSTFIWIIWKVVFCICKKRPYSVNLPLRNLFSDVTYLLILISEVSTCVLTFDGAVTSAHFSPPRFIFLVYLKLVFMPRAAQRFTSDSAWSLMMFAKIVRFGRGAPSSAMCSTQSRESRSAARSCQRMMNRYAFYEGEQEAFQEAGAVADNRFGLL